MAEATLGLYLPVLILATLAIGMVLAALSLPKLVAPRNPTAGKLSTYESGEVPVGNARGPIDVQYYLYVIVFLVIDVEIVFLLPWALNARSLGIPGLVELAIFVGLVLLGWVYAWKKGALQWQS